MQITEQWILDHAPGAALAESGRNLSRAGRFAALECSEDGKTYWGQCAGSAVNRYYVSLDWALSPGEPMWSCSCDSRHSPCKHVLGLMYELLSGKPFAAAEQPPYVLRMRAKRASELNRSEDRLKRARRLEAAAKDRRIGRQLEGLAKAERLLEKLVKRGGEGMTEASALSMERLASELDSRSLPGISRALERAAELERRLLEESGAEAGEEFLRSVSNLHALNVRAEKFLHEQLSSGSYAMEDPLLYELLGGSWNMDELREIGSFRRNARLVQLSFDVSFDEARRLWVERSFWLELGAGALAQSLELRSAKAGRFTALGDSCFDVLEIPVLFETPMVTCPRVWWKTALPFPLAEEERASLRDYAEGDLAAAASRARKELADPAGGETVPALLRVGRLGRVGEELVLENENGSRVALRDRAESGGLQNAAARLTLLPEPPKSGDALFGLFYYDGTLRRLCLHPYSVITPEGILRLQF